MLDTLTLRVAFGLVAACVLVLFWGATYRSTRSAYSGWWCVSLGLFIVSASLFVLNGTPVQAVANPLGNATGVLGAGCVWAGARSLRGRALPRWQLAVGPAVVLPASLLDDPAHDVWAGGAFYLAGMALLISRSAVELWCLLGERDLVAESRAQVHFAVLSMAVASTAIGAFYLARTGVFVAVGPRHPVFLAGFGSQATTLLTMILLVVVTFGMSALSHEQQTSDLRRRATRDGLTGLLNRDEFLRLARREIATGGLGQAPAVLVADLDRFKELNDGFGHAAGDSALTRFADACEEVVGARGLVGRLGGDEFVLLTLDDRAEQVAADVAQHYRASGGAEPSTASFGLAAVQPDDDIGQAMARADEALYRAKAAGRAHAVRWTDPAGEAGPSVRRTA
ncbi:diguanylate cyclase (GGDEF)-like protein [Nocardioides aromaticivorans]|uniref:Diguanylate cyclase (GGDEF)-like protein n=1 Tax=Nocardioides aromaticivorans TaxID=200618 RepID=A0A7Y9ZGN5_9ACTN|nr:GGDEF domain-containing protein [Nocardioides aromaticivorans]NYI43645.1 diguanylate cyclase (GGDEF)-like protein [Nocardioides aromaticivorans]QSR27623.1 GGDEF domain-containing protein [Nocardioides aromaticivorans]